MLLQIGVKVLIQNSENKYLFIKRTKLLHNEVEVSWDIPGGRIEPNESLDIALQRELQEEIGITLNSAPLLINAQDIFVSNKDLHVVRLTYRTRQDIDSLEHSDEHQAAAWLSLEDARNKVNEPFLKETLMLLP